VVTHQVTSHKSQVTNHKSQITNHKSQITTAVIVTRDLKSGQALPAGFDIPPGGSRAHPFQYTGQRQEEVTNNQNMTYDPATGDNIPFSIITSRVYPDWGYVTGEYMQGWSKWRSRR
jgi:hypothetical protein